MDARVAAIAEGAAHVFADLGCDVDEAHPGFADPAELEDRYAAALYAARLAPHLAAWEERMDPALLRFIRRGGHAGGRVRAPLRSARRALPDDRRVL